MLLETGEELGSFKNHVSDPDQSYIQISNKIYKKTKFGPLTLIRQLTEKLKNECFQGGCTFLADLPLPPHPDPHPHQNFELDPDPENCFFYI